MDFETISVNVCSIVAFLRSAKLHCVAWAAPDLFSWEQGGEGQGMGAATDKIAK